jgi:hypothetical protein
VSQLHDSRNRFPLAPFSWADGYAIAADKLIRASRAVCGQRRAYSRRLVRGQSEKQSEAASGGSLAASEYDEGGFGGGNALVTQFALEDLFIACSELLKSRLAF